MTLKDVNLKHKMKRSFFFHILHPTVLGLPFPYVYTTQPCFVSQKKHTRQTTQLQTHISAQKDKEAVITMHGERHNCRTFKEGIPQTSQLTQRQQSWQQQWQPLWQITHLPRNIRLDRKTLGLSRDLTRQDPPAARRREFGPKPMPVTKTPPAPPPTRVPGQDPDLAHRGPRQG